MTDPLGGATLLPETKIKGSELPAVVERRQCKELNSRSEQCKFPALSDSEYCGRHHVIYRRDQTRDIEHFREQMMINAKHDLLRLTPEATKTLGSLIADESAPAHVRLKAATEVLDRVGVRGGHEIEIDVAISGDPTKDIQDRLDQMREALSAAAIVGMRSSQAHDIEDAETDDDPDIIEAEVVESSDSE